MKVACCLLYGCSFSDVLGHGNPAPEEVRGSGGVRPSDEAPTGDSSAGRPGLDSGGASGAQAGGTAGEGVASGEAGEPAGTVGGASVIEPGMGGAGLTGAAGEPVAGQAGASGAASHGGQSGSSDCAPAGGLPGGCSVSGIVSGLDGHGLVLKNNAGGDLEISGNGRFEFSARLTDGEAYHVSVVAQPALPDQTCSVMNADGVVDGQNVTDIQVQCSPWTKIMGHVGQSFGASIAADGRGGLYVTGTTGTDPDGGGTAGREDVFLAKFTAAGDRPWSRQWGGPGGDRGATVSVSSLGEVYVAGGIGPDPDPGGAELGSAFVAKYDGDGTRVWNERRAVGSITNIAVDATGNVYAVGATAGGAVDGNAGLGERDGFLFKYDADGNWQWTRLIGTSGEDAARAVAVSNDGTVLVTGFVTGSLDGAPYVGVYGDIFLAAFDADGHRLWTRQFGTSEDDTTSGIATDRANDIYVTGGSMGSLQGDGATGGFVAKFDASGNRSWVRQLDAIFTSNGIGVDRAGDVYTTGAAFRSIGGEAHAGGLDAFLLKLSSTGATVWSRQFGHIGSDYGTALAFDPLGYVYVTGYTNGPFLDGNLIVYAEGFVVKYDSAGTKQ